MNTLKRVIRKIFPFSIHRRPSEQKVIELMAPFVRAGYNRAIVEMEEWMFENYRDVNFIPYADLADFMIKQMTEKKEYSSSDVVKELTINKKPGAM